MVLLEACTLVHQRWPFFRLLMKKVMTEQSRLMVFMNAAAHEVAFRLSERRRRRGPSLANLICCFYVVITL